MIIKSLTISGVGGIRELKLYFHKGFNVLCGPNGIGKTTILNIIADAFAGASPILKRHSLYPVGRYTIEYIGKNRDIKTKTLEVKEFDPSKQEHGRLASDDTPYLMLFSINRFISYQQLANVPRDLDNNIYSIGSSITNGISITDMKGWFVNRFLFSNTEGSMTEEQKINFQIAKKCFSIMDPTIEFRTIDSASFDIKLATKEGEIYFEYLSAGYKTCVYIILGLIKEIEFRFRDPRVTADNFDGVVLIDEIDLHLHPSWQARFVDALKELFPKAQFIVTTHSPSVLQCLRREEIIPLTMNDEGFTCTKELELGEYGLQGWTIEEILNNVMEMPTTSSKFYINTMNAYKRAVAERNNHEILSNYHILKKMLHPESVTGKLLDIQIAGIEEEE